MTQDNVSTLPKPLRLWPGVVVAAIVVLLRVVIPTVAPAATIGGIPVGLIGVLGSAAGALLILLWWLFFSRAPWAERLLAVALIAVTVFAVRLVVHESIRGAGMGYMYFFVGVATMTLALVAWAVAARRLSAATRRWSMAAALLLACGVWALVRTGGISGEGGMDIHWRWTPTPEEKLLATQTATVTTPSPAAATAVPPPAVTPSTPASETPVAAAAVAAPAPAPARAAEWPGFRGPSRDGVIHNVAIETDWARNPPTELWRKAIGPGWSSFAVEGELVYTQEQRGDDELISCYRLSTGDPVWRHRDAVRFYESNAGAGPRGTPTLHNGRLYAMGATGILNVLDAATGAKLWSRDTATDAEKKIPDWGIASSPLIVDNLVIVAVTGRLVAYDITTGKRQWIGEQGGGGYSSPHLATLDGVRQVLLVRGSRTVSVSPTDGKMLWDHNWLPAVSIVQPVVIGERDILIASHDGMAGNGMRRLEVKRGSNGWTVEEKWTSRGLKPYFNDTVVSEGHAYGFDGSILSSIDLASGERKWKGGRYGYGQMALLAGSDALLVLSEDGDIALVSATPDKYTELGRIKGIEGKTWNHPVVVRDILLVRNGQEMAAFRLPRRSTN